MPAVTRSRNASATGVRVDAGRHEQEQIKTLIDAMAASDLAEMEYSEDGWTLRLVKQSAPTACAPAPRDPRRTPRSRIDAQPLAAAAAHRIELPARRCTAWCTCSPSPGEPPFVQAGQAVAPARRCA